MMQLRAFVFPVALAAALGAGNDLGAQDPDAARDTTTPIKHVVVIFQENCSFDHYFGTYPHAANLPGETPFHPKPGTPTLNGLSPALLSLNPNQANPFRFPPSHAFTGGNTNGMTLEQQAYDGGLMDKFVQFTGTHDAGFAPTDVMGYFDGNTVTALWNYAQHFSISDNHFGTVSGATILGHINLISGQTHGARGFNTASPGVVVDTLQSSPGTYLLYQGTIVANGDSAHDNWATKKQRIEMTGKNVGDLLSAKGVSWGWFSGSFRDKSATHPNNLGVATADYGINREPFQLYASTANPDHVAPASVLEVGHDGLANHQYDLSDFWAAAAIHRMPAVSFFKAPNFETGHPGTDSTPLEEQTFLVETLNQLQGLPEWKETAVIIGWDDSDGWYDHQMPPIVNQSSSPLDALPGLGANPATIMGGYQARAGYGPRLPLLVISPFAKRNYIDHLITDQSSILRFIEDNWSLGRIGDFSFDARAGSLEGMFDFRRGPRQERLILDPSTGAVVGE
ncbi:MAG TPA: alkaline phosphatase family protein [Planctomycetota bacterium]|nr:alkaline phosphatase family protein [Planctomycetota bacterium]